MSCYEWEHGTIQLPKSKFAAIRKAFVDDYNQIKEYEFVACKRLRDFVFEQSKGIRDFDFKQAMFDNAERFGVTGESVYLMTEGTRKPKAMTRKAMGFANSKTMFFGDYESSVSFNKEQKTVTWNVEENNHARESARRSNLGRLFFQHMDKVQWTRGSGGEIIGNDEYNQDNISAGGGGNYVTQTFGK